MIWTFSAGPKLFMYETAVLVVGHSYGYFDNKNLLKVGAALSVVTYIILMLLVSLKRPLSGLAQCRRADGKGQGINRCHALLPVLALSLRR